MREYPPRNTGLLHKVNLSRVGYYLGADRRARWTQMLPTQLVPPQPPIFPVPRTGRLTFTNPYGVTIRWTDSGSVEVFARKPNTVANEMTGTWNSSERIEATKL